MKICPTCGREYPDYKSFCDADETPLPSSLSEENLIADDEETLVTAKEEPDDGITVEFQEEQAKPVEPNFSQPAQSPNYNLPPMPPPPQSNPWKAAFFALLGVVAISAILFAMLRGRGANENSNIPPLNADPNANAMQPVGTPTGVAENINTNPYPQDANMNMNGNMNGQPYPYPYPPYPEVNMNANGNTNINPNVNTNANMKPSPSPANTNTNTNINANTNVSPTPTPRPSATPTPRPSATPTPRPSATATPDSDGRK